VANGSGILGTVQPTGNPGQFLAADLIWRDPWPIGSIFFAAVGTNPATLLGFGTWQAISSGRVLVGLDASQQEFDALGETGGAKTHTLTTPEIPAHTHVQDAHGHTQNSHTHPSIQVQGGTTAATTGTHIMTSTATGGSSRAATSPELANAATAVNQTTVATNQNAGGGGAHNNLQPYLVVAIWQRMA